jgi:hypothetical protein
VAEFENRTEVTNQPTLKIIHKRSFWLLISYALIFILSGMRKKHPLDILIEAKRAKIASAERTLEKARIELATLEEARAAVIDHPIKPAVARAKANGSHPKGRRGRSLSETWKKVLSRIGAKGNLGASTDDIFAYCGAEGIELKRPTLRAQMSNYVKRGYLVRTSSGVFTLTSEGAKIAEMEAGTPR